MVVDNPDALEVVAYVVGADCIPAVEASSEDVVRDIHEEAYVVVVAGIGWGILQNVVADQNLDPLGVPVEGSHMAADLVGVLDLDSSQTS